MDTPLPIFSHKIETEFQLIVNNGAFRSMEDHATLESMVQSAADYAAGEYDGQVCGALELTYSEGMLVNVAPVADLSGRIHDELKSRPDWVRRQASAERWNGRAA